LRFAVAIFTILLVVVLSWGQPFSFSREIRPFELRDLNGRAFERPFLGGYNTPRPQFVDIDDDGDADMFVQESDGILSYFENTGTPQSAQWQWRTDDWFKDDIGAWFAIADANNDGLFDFLCQGNGLTMRYYEGDGQGGFTLQADTLFDTQQNAILPELQTTPVFYDIDCDGDQDLFLGRQTGSITFYENIGALAGMPRFEFVTDSWQDILIIGGGLLRGTELHGANNIAFADLEGSTATEMLFGDFFSRSLYYFVNNGSCPDNDLELAATGYPPPDTLATAGFNTPRLNDIDGDGDADLFVTVLGGFYSSTLNVVDNFMYYRNDGSSSQAAFSRQTSNYLQQWDGSEQSIPVLADIDDDGDPDLFVGMRNYQTQSASSGRLYFFENRGTLHQPDFFLADSEYVVVDGAYHYAPAFDDFDGDEDLDLLMGRDNGKLLYFENTGTPQSANMVLRSKTFADIDVGANSTPLIVDVDGDGQNDLLIGEFSGNLNYYKNDGDGAYTLIDEDFAGLSVLDEDYLTVALNARTDSELTLWIGGESGKVYFVNVDQDGEAGIQESGLRIQTRSAPFAFDIDADGDNDLICGNRGGGLAFFRNLEVSSLEAGNTTVPRHFTVSEGYPNPFNGSVRFRVENFATPLRVTVHDITGKIIRRLQTDVTGIVRWDARSNSGRSLPSGLYFFRFHGKDQTLSKKVLYLK